MIDAAELAAAYRPGIIPITPELDHDLIYGSCSITIVNQLFINVVQQEQNM
jgi:hypothetical protein